MSDPFVSRIVESVPITLTSEGSEGKVDTSLKEPILAEPPLEKWAEIKGQPYTAEYLGVNIWNEYADKSVNAIEGYIMNEIKKKGLEPTVSSYHEIMGKIMSFLQLSPNASDSVKFEKITGYVKLFDKLTKEKQRINKLIAELNELREVDYG